MLLCPSVISYGASLSAAFIFGSIPWPTSARIICIPSPSGSVWMMWISTWIMRISMWIWSTWRSFSSFIIPHLLMILRMKKPLPTVYTLIISHRLFHGDQSFFRLCGIQKEQWIPAESVRVRTGLPDLGIPVLLCYLFWVTVLSSFFVLSVTPSPTGRITVSSSGWCFNSYRYSRILAWMVRFLLVTANGILWYHRPVIRCRRSTVRRGQQA